MGGTFLMAYWTLVTIFLLFLLFSGFFLGKYLFQVLNPKEETFLDRIIKPLENFVYKVARIDVKCEYDWKEYLFSLLIFTFISGLVTFGILALQYYLPLNPLKLKGLPLDLNFNTTISYLTNTNWQSYTPESTMSYFSQMVGLSVQSFLSPTIGLCVAAVLVRALMQRNKKIGNFWVDLTRIVLYIFLPISLIFGVIFIAEGIPQNFSHPVTVYPIDQTLQSEQTIIQGPIASQEAIKLLGTNGGGYTNANSAHPYENPNSFVNFLQMFLILLIPVAQIFYFGRMAKNIKHSWTIIFALLLFFLGGAWTIYHFENHSIPSYPHSSMVNLEGKEMRFSINDSSLFTEVISATSCGASNCSLDSMNPLGGMVPLLNMQLGEIIFGGVGSGLYSIILYILIAVFIAGLIIGRTPEYLGQKIEAKDMKLAVIALLGFISVIVIFSSYAIIQKLHTPIGGPHGLTQVMYAYTSCTANNGSAFGGVNWNTPFFNYTLGLCLILGRFVLMIPMIALAGSFAMKKQYATTVASFPITGLLFVGLFIGTIILINALCFLPLVLIGPVLEHFDFIKGIFFS